MATTTNGLSYVVRGAVAQMRGRPDVSVGPGGGTISYVRPTGAPYQAWESLHVGSEQLLATLNRGTANTGILTIPASGNGVPDINVFPSGGGFEGIRMGGTTSSGSVMNGIAGSGINLTTLKPVANTSTVTQATAEASGTNQLYVIDCWNSTNPEFAGMTLQGTSQSSGGTYSAYYGGLALTNGSGGIIHDIKFVGFGPGYASAPPGETFPLVFRKHNNGSIYDCEFQGNGTAASLVGINTAVNVNIKRCLFNDATTGHNIPLYQVTGTANLVDNETATPSSGHNQINLERVGTSGGGAVVNIVRHKFADTVGSGQHIIISNDTGYGTINVYDPIFTGSNTKVKFKFNPTYNGNAAVQTTANGHGVGVNVNCWVGGTWNDTTNTYSGGTLTNSLFTVTG